MDRSTLPHSLLSLFIIADFRRAVKARERFCREIVRIGRTVWSEFAVPRGFSCYLPRKRL